MTTTEILVSHILTQGLVMMLQAAEVMVTSFGLFGLRCEGSFLTVTLLLLVQGLCGMCAGTDPDRRHCTPGKESKLTPAFHLPGFSISVFCDTVTSSNYVSMGSFVPIIVLSGEYNAQYAMLKYMRRGVAEHA